MKPTVLTFLVNTLFSRNFRENSIRANSLFPQITQRGNSRNFSATQILREIDFWQILALQFFEITVRCVLYSPSTLVSRKI